MASMRDVFADLKLFLNKNWLGCCYDILQSNNLPGRLLPHLRMCDLEFLGMEKDLALRLRNTIEVELWSWSGPMPRYKLVCSENAEDIHYFDAKTERSSFRRPPQMEKAIKDAGMDIEALRKDDKEVRTWLKNLAPANTHRPGKRIRKNLDRMHNPILPRKLARSFTPSTCPSSSLVIKKTLAQLPISIEATSQSPTRDSQVIETLSAIPSPIIKPTKFHRKAMPANWTCAICTFENDTEFCKSCRVSTRWDEYNPEYDEREMMD